jgi:hypothetical protein
MRIRFGKFVAVVVSATLAAATVSHAQSARAPAMNIAGPHASQPLFTPVNWIGKTDPRRQLTDIPELKEMGFTDKEIERARACSGIIVCPKNGDEKQTWGSATSLESSSQIVTAVHILFNGMNSEHPTFKRDLDVCFFVNYLNSRDRIRFKYDEAEKTDWSGRRYWSDNFQQGAVIHLERNIPHCKPFPVDRSDTPMREGDHVVSVGHATAEMYPRVSGKEPIGEICEIKGRTAREGVGSLYQSNCSSNPGQSGAALLVRRRDGDGHPRWMTKAIIIVSGPEDLDGNSFNLITGSYTDLLGIEGNFLREVLRGAGADVPTPSTLSRASKTKDGGD